MESATIPARQSGVGCFVISACSAAIAIADDVAEYHANLGGLLLNLQRNQEALVSLSRAQRLAADQFATLFNLSEAHRRTGDLEGAEQLLRRACELRPDSTDALHQLGLVLVARHRVDPGAPAVGTTHRERRRAIRGVRTEAGGESRISFVPAAAIA
ncbi:MAG: tetratricopeptide repeat protein [Planctomycetes bacterium]|nr:tetratricopeptide repeat protein [Planctomycetota bacterium]